VDKAQPGPDRAGRGPGGPDRAGRGPAAEEQPGVDDDMSFLDWAPSAEEPGFSLDEDSRDDAGALGGGPSVGVGTWTETGEPVVKPVEATDAPPRREGIGHRLGRLDHIFGDTRMGVWRRRAVIAIVVGLIFTILLDWRVGLTLAVVAGIADTIYRSRRVPPARAGTRLTKTQKQTQRQLAKLERAGYRALHSRPIPNSDDYIDHLVVGPAGVFSIDSEAWHKKLPVRTKNARQLWVGPESKKHRLEHAQWEAGQASEYLTRHADRQLLSGLPGGTISVRPAMAVYGPKIPWDVATIRDVDVFSGGRLRYYLRRYARQNHARPLNPTQVEQVYQVAQQAFPDPGPGPTAS
jgi:hypothetical protein